MSPLPSLSIITVTLNCEGVLQKCLARLASQDYPRDRIETLVVDGGSSDRTPDVASAYGATFIRGGYRDNQEARRCVGLSRAANEIVCFLDSDNYLPHDAWLRRMVEPFEDPEIVGTQPLRYLHQAGETLMNRYFALFGVNDPVAFYLGKADRLSYLYDSWNLKGKILRKTARYATIEFDADEMPTIGSNGFLTRKSALDALGLKPEEFFHIDVQVDLVRKGLNRYGIVNEGIVHSTGETFFRNMAKRISYMRIHREQLKDLRRYKVFDGARAADRLNLLKFIVFSATFIEPLFLSVKGYCRLRDRAWFIHPFVCFGFLCAYAVACASNALARIGRRPA